MWSKITARMDGEIHVIEGRVLRTLENPHDPHNGIAEIALRDDQDGEPVTIAWTDIVQIYTPARMTEQGITIYERSDR